ncbi:hypothetical protein BDA99DRAFT_540382 [Phascolomyces articulosus]|uniref:Uncharacterized protein n=1 Tax=Phascolomyces articulosus TaxID=60185 RepID=A0AAD5PCX1_9FUNG|nr:hypothetical protein BDA99DRAFT_540382 [Phascolomyces articulosus]
MLEDQESIINYRLKKLTEINSSKLHMCKYHGNFCGEDDQVGPKMKSIEVLNFMRAPQATTLSIETAIACSTIYLNYRESHQEEALKIINSTLIFVRSVSEPITKKFEWTEHVFEVTRATTKYQRIQQFFSLTLPPLGLVGSSIQVCSIKSLVQASRVSDFERLVEAVGSCSQAGHPHVSLSAEETRLNV